MTRDDPGPRRERYTHGHHESVLASHVWRTAENSAGYLLASLQPGMRFLDAGCGPGTITLDLADLVAPGPVIGLDTTTEVLTQAAHAASLRPSTNASFITADVCDMAFVDACFDVVHAHQLLHHLARPVEALGEMRRVLRPGGLLAVREVDYGTFLWAPADPLLDRWLELYHQVSRHNGAEPDTGRHLPGWVRAAGFCDLTITTATWTFADEPSRSWWGGLWADRVRWSAFAEQAQEYGLSNEAELQRIAEAFVRCAAQPDGFFAMLHTEVLARR